MTKKHFKAFAEFIAKYGQSCEPQDQIATKYARIDMARMVCQVAQADNPRFDEKRFVKACGLEDCAP